MKLSLSGRLVELSGSATAIPVVEFLELASRCGYDAVDLRASQLNAGTSASDVREIAEALKRLNLSVFAGQYNAPLLTQEDEGAFTGFARTLSGLGARNVRMSAAPDVLKRACRLAKPFGLTVHYQMHTNSPFESITGAAEVVKAIGEPNFGLVPEPANLALAGQPFSREMLAPLRGAIAGVHVQTLVVRADGVDGVDALKLCDGTKVSYTRVPYADNDCIPFGVFFEALRFAGFDGYVNELEPRPTDGASEAVAAEAADFLKQFL